MRIDPKSISFIRCRPAYSPSALGDISFGDVVTLAPPNQYETRICIVTDIKSKHKAIPKKHRPPCDSQKYGENKRDNGGVWILAVWLELVSESRVLEKKIKEVEHESNDITVPHLRDVSDREVVLTGHGDWMPLVDVVDTADVHHWRSVAEDTVDIKGRESAYWIRYQVAKNKEIEPVNDWEPFAEGRFPLQRESLPYRRYSFCCRAGDLLVSILTRGSQRQSRKATRSMPCLVNDWDWLCSRVASQVPLLEFEGGRTVTSFRGGYTEKVIKLGMIHVLRVTTASHLAAVCAIFGDRVRRGPCEAPQPPRPKRLRKGEEISKMERTKVGEITRYNVFDLPKVSEVTSSRKRPEADGFDIIFDHLRGQMTVLARVVIVQTGPGPDLPQQQLNQDLPIVSAGPPTDGMPSDDMAVLIPRARFVSLYEGSRELYELVAVGPHHALSVSANNVLAKIISSPGHPGRENRNVQFDAGHACGLILRHLGRNPDEHL